jgi:hypothetical protein
VNPNVFAIFMLGSYPLLIIGFFSLYKPARALTLSLVVAEVILPPKITLPIAYPTWLTKWTLAPLATFVVLLIMASKSLRRSRPLRGVESSFVILLVGAFMTMWTNRDALHYGPVVLQGESFSDFFSDAVRSVSDPWVVFFMGRAVFKSSRDLVYLCRTMAVAAVCLIIPILIEIRLSPQLNHWIYGYEPSDFSQLVRGSGYRPEVFFGHGLMLSAFLLACLVLSVGLARAKLSVSGYSAKVFCVAIGVTLIACKSMGSILYALILVPVLLWASPKRVATIATILMLVFVSYPILRWNGIIPTKGITDFFVGISQERAHSLQYRFNMEDGMLDLARQRAWFGFGNYGRFFVYNPVTGARETVPDGVVALTLAGRGFVCFYSYFFPYAYAILRARRLIMKLRKPSNRALLAALSLQCSIILFDLIINSAFIPLFMTFFGILYAMPSVMMKEEAAESAAAEEWGYPEPAPATVAVS